MRRCDCHRTCREWHWNVFFRISRSLQVFILLVRVRLQLRVRHGGGHRASHPERSTWRGTGQSVSPVPSLRGNNPVKRWGAAIAQWICLSLPPCYPRVRVLGTPSTRFWFIVKWSNCHCIVKRTKISRKDAGVAHIFKKRLNRSLKRKERLGRKRRVETVFESDQI